MKSDELIKQAERIMGTLAAAGQMSWPGAFAQAAEFLRVYGGPKNSFLERLHEIRGYTESVGGPMAARIMQSYIEYVRAGLAGAVSPERRAQLDVVSDFLEQAHVLLETEGVHPAAPVVLIGATLEEFLRTWVESAGLTIGSRKPGLDAYATVLREADLITKQDMKDITSWGGLRNHAAHGEWEQVADKLRARLMLEGVNLFMRKHGTNEHA